jgi:hypothetical protein
MFDVRTVSPPGIALVAAFALIYTGISTSHPEMVMAGWVFLGVAVFLQLAYLFLRNWKPHVYAERRPGSIRRALFQLLVDGLPEVPEGSTVLSPDLLFDSD